MGRETRELSELGNIADIDFSKGEWSWGFGPVDVAGPIYHAVDDNHEPSGYLVTEYKVPPFMAEIITTVRDAALFELKTKLIGIEQQRDRLLEI